MIHQSAALACHSHSRTTAVDRIVVDLLCADSTLSVSYTLEGDLARLRVPAPETPRRADRLWLHTCFEAFLRSGDSPAYHELNFAPSGEWAAYAFRAYRERDVFEVDFRLQIMTTVEDGRLRLEALVPLAPFSFAPRRPLRLALSAVIEEQSGALTYWALAHPAGRPDFHHPDAFVLRLGGFA